MTREMLRKSMKSKSWDKKVMKWRNTFCYGCEYFVGMNICCELGFPNREIYQNFACPNHTNPIKVTRLLSKQV